MTFDIHVTGKMNLSYIDDETELGGYFNNISAFSWGLCKKEAFCYVNLYYGSGLCVHLKFNTAEEYRAAVNVIKHANLNKKAEFEIRNVSEITVYRED